jgi:hypothetical protein
MNLDDGFAFEQSHHCQTEILDFSSNKIEKGDTKVPGTLVRFFIRFRPHINGVTAVNTVGLQSKPSDDSVAADGNH